MRSVLAELNDVVGVKGSLVVTTDGMVVASLLSRQLDEDFVAAMAASVIQRTRRAMSEAGMGSFTRTAVVATHGKVIVTDAGPAFLVVVMDHNVETGPADIEIQSAAMRIRNYGEIRI